MAQPKTKAKAVTVAQFLDQVADDDLRREAQALLALMQQVTKQEPQLWRGDIVGFGAYHYVDARGRQGDWCLAGFAPRGGMLALFLHGGWEHQAELLAQLGKHALRQEILTIKRLDDVSLPVLKRLMMAGFKHAKQLAKEEAQKQAKA